MIKKIFSDKAIADRVVFAQLSNGLKVYVCEKKGYNTFHAVFGTKYGSVDTRFSRNGGEAVSVPEGIAHFLEHKLFESEDGDAFELFSKTGAYSNAYTSFDRTCYLFSCTDRFFENLDILLSFVQSPYFTEATVKKEQGIIGQEIRMYDDNAGWYVLFSLLRAMYSSHPVRIDIAGTVESIAEINAKLLFECYNTFYNPSNMFLCIAGDVCADEVIEHISSKIKPSVPVKIERFFDKEPESVIDRRVSRKMAVAQPIFTLGYKEKCDGERSLRECICSDMLLDAIAGDVTPLYERLVGAGDISDEFDTEYFQGNGYAVSLFSGEAQNPEHVAGLIKDEIERLKNEGICDAVFESVRRSMYGSAIRRFNSVDNVVSLLTDSAVSDFSPFEDIEILRSVTKSEVEARLSILNPDCLVLSVINPKEEK